MKINSISFAKTNILNNSHKVLFCSNNKDEIIKPLSNGTTMVLRGVDYITPDKYQVKYLGIFDKNNGLIKDMRYDKRYNEIRAIEYQKPYGGFNFIQGGLTVSFDKDENIRNIYLINKVGENTIHNVLNDKHGLSLTMYDKNNAPVQLNRSEFQEQLNYFLGFTYDMLLIAQENNLIGSKDVLDKFSKFSQSVI